MFIRNLKVSGIKLLRDFELSFLNSDGTPRQWTMLVGENGLCKTTVLQCIALAASGRSVSNAITDKSWVTSLLDKRNDLVQAEIKAELGFRTDSHHPRTYPGSHPRFDSPPTIESTLWLDPGRFDFKGLSKYVLEIDLYEDPLDQAQGGSFPRWFVGGYGTARYISTPSLTPKEPPRPLDRLHSLFDQDPIAGTGFVNRFPNSLQYVKLVREALVSMDVLPNVHNMELRGYGGISRSEQLVDAHSFEMNMPDGTLLELPATWMSQGYQGTIAWIADLIGQIVLEADHAVELDEMEGIVLIDEIDMHLHPKWQRSLITSLTRAFPRMQFIATTHSPMVLPALAKEEIWHLRQDDAGNVVADPSDTEATFLTGTEIYEEFFDLPPRDREVEKALDTYALLSRDPSRSEAEERELEKSLARLKAADITPGWETVPRNEAS